MKVNYKGPPKCLDHKLLPLSASRNLTHKLLEYGPISLGHALGQRETAKTYVNRVFKFDVHTIYSNQRTTYSNLKQHKAYNFMLYGKIKGIKDN